ncbi:hypothetical protein G5I_14007 [Acromyrmex echinatior]|uniref:Uncharacterized protein n=1 Tax=Acromyrmex echinatior TaxID=103372 RepID=F4X6N9_ACREC|nr:hypothetical protein G5I_14007 [Acromyrmex echinatior]
MHIDAEFRTIKFVVCGRRGAEENEKGREKEEKQEEEEDKENGERKRGGDGGLGGHSKIRFLRRRGFSSVARVASPREWSLAILHRLESPSWRRQDGGESIPVPVLFRIIDVKNILEALINVGREDIREGQQRRSSHTPSCYWISIGKRLFLSSDRGCHFGSFVTEMENFERVTSFMILLRI